VTRYEIFRSDLRRGRADGFPLCCRARFALTYALDRESEQAGKRGIRFAADSTPYIPCGWLHEATLTHREYEQLLALPGGSIARRALERWPAP
jgi:hypothetical protein